MQNTALFLVGIAIAKVAEKAVFDHLAVFTNGYLKGNVALCVGAKTLGNGFYILFFHKAATFHN